MDVKTIRLKNLRRIIDERFNGVAGQCADALGMKRPQMSRWVTANQKSRQGIAEESAREIERKLGYPMGYLDEIARNDHAATLSDTEKQNVFPGPDIRGRIPLISWVQAGTWSEVVDIYEPGYAERWLPFLKNNGENVFALRVEGDSMTARFGKSYPDGCIIFVDPDQRMPTNGDRIVAKLVGSQKTTFKSYTEDAGRKWLRPLNDSHPPIYDEFFVIGKVIGKWEDD